MKNLILFLPGLLVALNISFAGTLAQFRTVFGDIEVELYDRDKPVTVQNFIRYIESGRYQDGIAHRLVPGFVIQGGGFTIASNVINAIPTYASITNEFNAGQKLSNVFGTIAMAKASDPNSATSQFFFNLANNSASLDNTNNSGGFTVFGRVIRGTNVLQTFNAFQNYTGTQQSNIVANIDASLNYVFYPNFASCPLLYPSLYSTNFVFMDITLLKVQVALSNNVRRISWNSIVSRTNIVEYTTNFPPSWKTLASTNGNGGRLTITDSSTDPRRFYRVRVVY